MSERYIPRLDFSRRSDALPLKKYATTAACESFFFLRLYMVFIMVDLPELGFPLIQKKPWWSAILFGSHQSRNLASSKIHEHVFLSAEPTFLGRASSRGNVSESRRALYARCLLSSFIASVCPTAISANPLVRSWVAGIFTRLCGSVRASGTPDAPSTSRATAEARCGLFCTRPRVS